MKFDDNHIGKKITIVTPCYNSEKYIEECIESIKRQNYRNYEHIIIDGGSTDSTLEIIKKHEGTYPMKYLSEKDNGMYDAIAKGFSMGTGDVFCWLNSDDMFAQAGTLKIVSDIFSKYDVDWMTGTPSRYDEKGTNYGIPRLANIYVRKYLKKGYYDGRILGFVQQESTFWSRDLWMKSQGEEIISKYKMAGDYHLWREFAKFADLCSVDCVLSGFRIHEGQKSSDIDAYYREIGSVTKSLMMAKRYFLLFEKIYRLFIKKQYIRYKN